MVNAFTGLWLALPKLTLTSVVDIIAVAILIYQFILIVRGRRAAHILTGVLILAAVYVLAKWARLELLRSILAGVAPYTAFALIVVFQSDIRRTLARLGRRRVFGVSELERRELMEEILLALQQLSQKRVGALIVVERKIGLRTFTESGVRLDAAVSSELLCAIFEPGNPLHDGAVILQGDRIAAAGCFLPLATSPVLIRQLGTRHRAAIGVTEEADCLAVVVSEGSGRISLCRSGEMEADVSLARVEEGLIHTLDRPGGRIAGYAPALRAGKPVPEAPLSRSTTAP